ncbi:hypothetical protein [Streptomyces sp. SPB162]|uniref:hypothetical protein n=1 Tax=Streptomyces sp. SPB162 TaxID=2940560 RepID=UPI0024049532|nr:hypothetical protein [Streptomyces sp. SPB162]
MTAVEPEQAVLPPRPRPQAAPAVPGARLRFGYASGSLVTGTFNTLPGLLLLPYLTDTLGIGAALAGTGWYCSPRCGTPYSTRWSAGRATAPARAGARAGPTCCSAVSPRP